MLGRKKGPGILPYSRVKTEALKNTKREKKKMQGRPQKLWMFFLKNHSRENQIPVDYGTWGNWWCFFGKRKILTFGQKLKKSTSKTRRFMQGGYKICT